MTDQANLPNHFGAGGSGPGRDLLTLTGISTALVAVGVWVAQQFYGIAVPASLFVPLTVLIMAASTGIHTAGRWLLDRLDRRERP